MANDKQRDSALEQMGEALGGMAGRMAGRATDAAMNVAGSLMGPMMDMMGDWWSTPDAKRASSSFREREQDCQEHFRQTRGTQDFDTARPSYEFGHLAGQNPDYQGRSFREVEPELERVWDQAGRERFGEWPRVRDSVEFGYGLRPGGVER